MPFCLCSLRFCLYIGMKVHISEYQYRHAFLLYKKCPSRVGGMHSFPQDAEVRQQWIVFCKRESIWVPAPSSRLGFWRTLWFCKKKGKLCSYHLKKYLIIIYSIAWNQSMRCTNSGRHNTLKYNRAALIYFRYRQSNSLLLIHYPFLTIMTRWELLVTAIFGFTKSLLVTS